MIYTCCDERRRNDLKGNTSLNGIDFLEVVDQEAPTEAERQRILKVHFVNDLGGIGLTPDNIRIEGGERIRGVVVTVATPGAGSEANVLTVEVDRRGDFSVYSLRLVQSPQAPQPPAGVDPMLTNVDFSFKVECPSPFDCQDDCFCSPESLPSPDIDYLAKDYASFRRLMLDRMAAMLPEWRERNAADLGIALVELLAYAGDYLSYQQDAVATEAYLDTSRRRVSVRRHALLVDYRMHDGCNARTWVQVKVGADVLGGPGTPALPRGTALATRLPDQKVGLPNDPVLLQKAHAVFETMHNAQDLFAAHNELPFYTWSDRECCLPKGARRATLKGQFLRLKPGDVLVFEEVLGPRTSRPADADLGHRHAVRLTSVDPGTIASPKTDPLTGQQITDIEWAAEDGLRFPLCVSARTDPEHGRLYIEDVSVARGNIVLADHGRTIKGEPLGKVPAPDTFLAPDPTCDPCDEELRRPIYPRFRPRLRQGPISQQGSVPRSEEGATELVPFDPDAPASRAMKWEMDDVLPAIELESALGPDTDTWRPQRDLLNSDATQTEFVVEIELDGVAQLRLGDDRHAARPEPGTLFSATYRVGNGAAGNIGAESLAHIVSNLPEIVGVRNPLPAGGGVEPETVEQVRQNAPQAFRTQERAVTEADYAEKAEGDPEVQLAAGTFRWTGSW
ncbi:MAG: putative baseplate assembly protein, partial [Planctomycetes bacterium]|nr:putative baseplate assembly protein [Planctomycetota bacterium]